MPPRNKKKPAGTAIDRRNGARISLAAPTRPDIPAPPSGLRPDVVQAWEAYWADGVATIAKPVDLPVVKRWATNLNRMLTLVEVADANPVVPGSTGQMRSNPLYDTVIKLEASVRADEAQLGIGPKSRVHLGIAAITERRSIADLNARYMETETEERDDDVDPRLTVIEGEVI